jgi:PPP family 3-phenylpropionic acid transporter
MGASVSPAASGSAIPGLIPLAGVYALFFAVAGALMPYLPVYLQYRGLTLAEIGLVLGLGMALKVVAPHLWAALAERTGQRMRLVRLGVLAGLLVFSLLPLAPDAFWPLAALLLAYQFVWNAVLPQFEAVTLNHLGAKAGAYGRIRLWGSIGFVIAVLGAGAFTERVGIEWLVPVVGVMMLLLFAQCATVAESLSKRVSGAVGESGTRSPFAAHLLRPAVIAFLISAALMQASHGPYYVFFTLHLESLGMLRTHVAFLWILGVVAEIVMFALAPRLLSSVSARRLLVLCMLVAVLRWLLMAVAGASIVLLVVGQLCHAVTFGLYHAASMQLVRFYFPGAHLGRGQAMYASVGFGIGGALGSTSGGVIWTHGGPLAAYCAAAGMVAIAAVVLVCFRYPGADLEHAADSAR